MRNFIAKDKALMDRLTDIISQSDFDVPQEVTLREHTLKILYRVYQKQPILHL